jgi:uncharacterized protein (TIGR03435 family)
MTALQKGRNRIARGSLALSLTLGVSLAFIEMAAGQQRSPEKPIAFDAASVKPYQVEFPGGGGSKQAKQPAGRRFEKPSGGPGTGDPGRIHYPGVTLQFVLMNAYGVNNFQIAGPVWLNGERFDIDATMPADTTKEQFRAMLQNLLADRFKMESHRETRELSGYSLVVAKNGPKFKASAEASPPPDDGAPDPPLTLGPDQFFVPPQRPGMFLQMTTFPGARSTFRQFTMAALANVLQNQLKRPVNDATGLTAKYDFVVNFSMEGLDLGSGRIPVSPGDGEPQPDILSALQSQLGLKLESKKEPTEVIVIDHIEKTPTGN